MALIKGKDLTNESVRTLLKFQSGESQPITTGIDHLDEALLGGMIPSTVVGIVARSGHGKTHDIETIKRHILSTHEDVVFLDCAWEMEHFKLLVRELSAVTGKSVKKILFEQVSEEDADKFKEVCNRHRSERVYYENGPTPEEEFTEDVQELIQLYPGNRIVVSIDNLENLLVTKGDQKKAMDSLLSKINRLKKTHPFICFIILNQMNDDYLDRIHDIKRHRPIEKDIYSTGQLFKLCDVLYFKIVPWKLGIQDKFMVFGNNQYQWLKEHILPAAGRKTTSFDPYGRAFYFYLKIRQPEDIKDVKDIHVSVLYTKFEAGFKEATSDIEAPPSFEDKRKNTPPIDLAAYMKSLSLSPAKGQGFEITEKQSDYEPF